MEDSEVGFKNVDTTGHLFVKYMQDLIWYLDTHWITLKEAVGLDIPKFVQKVYQARSGRTLGDILPYNNYTAKKKPKPKLSQESLRA